MKALLINQCLYLNKQTKRINKFGYRSWKYKIMKNALYKRLQICTQYRIVYNTYNKQFKKQQQMSIIVSKFM